MDAMKAGGARVGEVGATVDSGISTTGRMVIPTESSTSPTSICRPGLATKSGQQPDVTRRLEGESMKTSKKQSLEAEVKSRSAGLDSSGQVLLSRLRRLQGRECQRHLQRHISYFVRRQQSLSGLGCQILRDTVKDRPYPPTLTTSYPPHSTAINGSTLSSSATSTSVKPPSHQPLTINPITVNGDIISRGENSTIRVFNQDNVKSMSTAALVNFVKKLEDGEGTVLEEQFRFQHTLNSSISPQTNNNDTNHVPNQSPLHEQQNPFHHHSSYPETPTKALAANNNTLVKLLQKSSPSVDQRRNRIVSHHPPIDRSEAALIDSSAGQLRTNLEYLEEEYDSDATDGSSDGESGDECRLFWEDGLSWINNNLQNGSTTPTTPSGRIRTPTFAPKMKECHSYKWASERGEIASRWMWLIAQVADLEFKIRQQNDMYRNLRLSKGPIVLEARSSPSPTNSRVPSEPSSSSSTNPSSPPEDNEPSTCVRTMPIRSLKRRKLVRSSSALAGATRKYARYSTLSCSCNSMSSSIHPCVLCNGRFNYVQVIDPDSMPSGERTAILDSSCHPVLSLPNQVCLGLHFCKFLKTETIVSRGLVKKQLNKKKSSPSEIPSPPKFDFKIKNLHNKNKSQAVISSNKLRKKYEAASNNRNRSNHHHHYSTSGKRGQPGRDRHDSSSNDSCRHDSPIPGSRMAKPNYVQRRRRSDHDAYDINNIVIDYSIASTPRIEKLQYKEILTPKWREVDLSTQPITIKEEMEEGLNDPTDLTQIPEEVEDLSDSVFQERHSRYELEEKKRYLIRPVAVSKCPNNTTNSSSQFSNTDNNNSQTVVPSEPEEDVAMPLDDANESTAAQTWAQNGQ